MKPTEDYGELIKRTGIPPVGTTRDLLKGPLFWIVGLALIGLLILI